MKKTVLTIAALLLLTSVSSANCASNCQKIPEKSPCNKNSKCTCNQTADCCKENSIDKDNEKNVINVQVQVLQSMI